MSAALWKAVSFSETFLASEGRRRGTAVRPTLHHLSTCGNIRERARRVISKNGPIAVNISALDAFQTARFTSLPVPMPGFVDEYPRAMPALMGPKNNFVRQLYQLFSAVSRRHNTAKG